MNRRMNTLLIDDTEYPIDAAYVVGARAFRRHTPVNCNPHSTMSDRYSQWDAGHTHEAAGLHLVDGIDVIETGRVGRQFVTTEKGL